MTDLRAELERRKLLPHPGHYDDEPAGSFESLLQQLDGADCVVASRFHGVLLSLLLGKPTIGISMKPSTKL